MKTNNIFTGNLPRLFLLILLFFSLGSVSGQTFNGWLSENGSARLSQKFSLHFDVQVRSTDQLQYLQTIIFRPGLHYHIAPNQMITMGYAFIAHHRFIDGVDGWGYEQRIWEQYIYNQSFSMGGHASSLQHRLRFEQRFNSTSSLVDGKVETTGHFFSQRLRYLVRGIFPFQKQSTFIKGTFFALQNEIMVNIGDASNVNGKFFDQNRAYIAVGYRISKKYDVETGYLNQFVEGRNGSTVHNIIQLAFYTRF